MRYFIIVLLIGGVYGYPSLPSTSVQHYETSVKQLLDSMDLNTSPCQDFYQFACGNWIKTNPMPKSKSRWTQFDVLREQLNNYIKGILQHERDESDSNAVNTARDMYAACMDTDAIEAAGLKPITDFLAKFGGWPLTLDHWDPSSFDWKSATVATRRIYATAYLLSVFSSSDPKDTRRNAIQVDQGSLSLPRNILVNTTYYPRTMKAYAKYATEVGKLIRDSLHQTQVTDNQIEIEVEEMIKFESALANITAPPDLRRNNSAMYHPMSLAELQRLTDSVETVNPQAKIDWYNYLESIYSFADVHIVPNEERMVVVSPDYLKNLVRLLDRTPPRVLANYINWRFVRLLSPYASNKINRLSSDFSKILNGNTQTESRSSSCASDVNSYLGFAVGSKYIQETFDDASKKEVGQMIRNIKGALRTSFEESPWLDPATRSKAMEKVDEMVDLVAYPEWIKDRASLENFYQGLVISRHEHFQNIENVNAWLTKARMKSLRQRTSRSRWSSFPTVVNAFYTPTLNAITFPAGILQPPFFGLTGRLAAMNYGGIGSVIGHEITHGFDDKGRQSDKYGNNVQWWTDETLSKYLKRTQCFIEKYSNYTIPNGSRLNGVMTQGENIADNGGLLLSFKAYEKYVAVHGPEPHLPGLEQFTNEQIFFISFANIYCGTETPERLASQIQTDPHSPSRYRVQGVLSNNEDFLRTFNCGVDSPMNHLNKCSLWQQRK